MDSPHTLAERRRSIGLLVWTSNRSGPDRVGWFQSNPYGWARSSSVKKKKKKSGPGLGLKPSQLKLCLLRLCLTKHTLCLCHAFLSPFILIFSQTNEPFFYIRKFLKYLGIFVDLFGGPRVFFFFYVLFFSSICSICGLLLLNGNLLCNVFFFFLFLSKKSK